VSAAWTPPNDVTWTYLYDGTNDSLPDTQAEPRWRKFASTAANTLGTEAWVAGTSLNLAAATNANSIYFARRDSLGTMSANMKATVIVPATTTGAVQAVFGFVEPTTGGNHQVFVGVSQTGVGFVTSNLGSSTWSFFGAPTVIVAGSSHTYKLRKVGVNPAVLCMDGVQIATMNYGNWNTVRGSFNTSTVVFGLDGNGVAGGTAAKWSSVAYTIGDDGTNCA